MDKPFTIIGAGIIGSAIAREIRKRDLGDVLVLEKEGELGKHATGRNSGVIHSGINHLPGTLKSRMCLEGSKRLRNYCTENNVPMKECGTILIARNRDEEFGLYTVMGMGNELGVPDLQILSQEELEEREPGVTGKKALLSPSGAIVDSKALLNRVAQDAIELGAKYLYNTELIDIKDNRLITTKGEFEAGHIINCAGLHADRIAHMMNVGLDYRMIPFRGEYMGVRLPINSMVYQVPNLKFPFLGVHFTRTIDGEVLAGPNATLAFGRESYDKEIKMGETIEMLASSQFSRLAFNREFLSLARHNILMSLSSRYFLREINNLLKEPLTKESIYPQRAGIRAQLVDRTGKMINDLVVDYQPKYTNVLNAVSPGMTCSLAFAEHIVNEISSRKY